LKPLTFTFHLEEIYLEEIYLEEIYLV